MLDFVSPREFEGELYQPKSLIKPPHLNLEDMVNQLIKERRVDFCHSELKGKLGEIVSREIMRYNLEQKSQFDSNKLFDFRGKEYVIGESNRGEVVKFDSAGRIVLIKKSNSWNGDSKFGFNKISEIDGILRLRKRLTRRKRQESYVVIESKTGKIDVDSIHIRDRILKPYSRILDAPISYALVGFEEYLIDAQRKLKSKVSDIYETIMRENTRRRGKQNLHSLSFTTIPFPFSQEYFEHIVTCGMELQEGVLSIRGNFNTTSNLLTMKNSKGEESSGVYIPENHPHYRKIQQLLNSS
ncbi:MAG: hypothetical protein ACLFPL_00965 [Candidatus Nanoarchaeia archaeon]